MGKIRWHIAQFFELLWWKKYVKGKSPKEYLEWKRNYWNEFLTKIQMPLEQVQGPVIDIGCGPAGIFTILKQQEVVALDPLLANYDDLAVFNRMAYEGVQFETSSFEAFSSSKLFHTVFCLNAINHFKDLKGSFQKLYNITEGEGQVIVSIDAHNHAFFRRLFSFLPLDILHPHQYYLEEYEAFLIESGFSIVRKVLIKKEFFFDYWVLIGQKQK